MRITLSRPDWVPKLVSLWWAWVHTLTMWWHSFVVSESEYSACLWRVEKLLMNRISWLCKWVVGWLVGWLVDDEALPLPCSESVFEHWWCRRNPLKRPWREHPSLIHYSMDKFGSLPSLLTLKLIWVCSFGMEWSCSLRILDKPTLEVFIFWHFRVIVSWMLFVRVICCMHGSERSRSSWVKNVLNILDVHSGP